MKIAGGPGAMKRFAFVVLAWFILGPTSPASAQDVVTYYNRATKKEVPITGTIQEETTAGIKIKSRGMDTLIPAIDVRVVEYKFDDNDKMDALSFRAPGGKMDRALLPATKDAERKKLLEEAFKENDDLLPRLKTKPLALRYAQFRGAQIRVLQAQDDPAKVDAAIAALAAFKKEHAKSWEMVHCLKLLARLHEDKGDTEAATQAYQDLATLPDVPPEMKQESEILVGKLLLRGKKYSEAETKFKALVASISDKDPQRGLVQVYLIQSQMGQGNAKQSEEQLKAILNATSDASVKAAAHNVLGDFLMKERPDDAFWNYLKVDTLYNQDKEEHAKALYFLAQLFDKLKNDPVRAQQCIDKLHQLEGTEYQKRAAAEKK
jgi:hypothetical protein